jgi:hypothetical protein
MFFGQCGYWQGFLSRMCHVFKSYLVSPHEKALNYRPSASPSLRLPATLITAIQAIIIISMGHRQLGEKSKQTLIAKLGTTLPPLAFQMMFTRLKYSDSSPELGKMTM